jgi:predicted NAD/FAD-dependent oxidoreductase
MASPSIAIIGAGMAGLKAASTLHKAGFQISVFEKSRGLGGRMATRRTDVGLFNHGAQYVTARHPDFARFIDQARQSNAASVWHPRLNHANSDHTANDGNTVLWHRGQPAMNKFVQPFVGPFGLQKQVKIAGIDKIDRNHFLLLDSDGKAHGPFDGVISTAPAPQALELLSPLATRFEEIAKVDMAPCWAAMVAFDRAVPTPFDALLHPGPVISWASKTEGKGPGHPELWVIHASADWSRAHLENNADQVANDLMAEFETALGTDLPSVVSVSAHRWRYARTETPLGKSHLSGVNGRIIAAGDWCLGARVEAAFRSGKSAAHALIETFYG